jgi:hypothetical protein
MPTPVLKRVQRENSQFPIPLDRRLFHVTQRFGRMKRIIIVITSSELNCLNPQIMKKRE